LFVLLLACLLAASLLVAQATSMEEEMGMAETDLMEMESDVDIHSDAEWPNLGNLVKNAAGGQQQNKGQPASKGTLKKASASVQKSSKKSIAGAKKSVKKAAKAQKKAAKALKKAKAAVAKAKKTGNKADLAKAKKAKQQAKKAINKAAKAQKKQSKKVKAALAAVAKRAAAKAKKLGLTPAQAKKFIAQQKKKAKSRLNPKKASQIKDKQLKKLIQKVKRKQDRKSISKLQRALLKKKAGSVSVPIKHHKITVHPRRPRRKKVKVHKESPTDKNYLKHLHQAKKRWKAKIKDLKAQIHALSFRGKQDLPIEYSLLDPPDESKAAAAAELLNDFKPFLKDARSIKQADLEEGRENLVTMEKLRWEVRNKLDKARATPLLPEIYRFIE